MVKQNFITPNEVAIELGISKSYAYKITRELNNELKAKGFITIAGKVSRVYFEEKFYGHGVLTTNLNNLFESCQNTEEVSSANL